MLKKLLLSISLSGTLLLGLLPVYEAGARPTAAPQRPFAPGELLVKLRPQAQGSALAESPALPPLDSLNRKYAVRAMEQVFKQPAGEKALLPSPDATPAREELSLVYRLRLPPEADILAIAQEYACNPAVEYAEPNYLVSIALAPDDYYYNRTGTWGQPYPDMWGQHRIQAESAWDVAQGSAQVVIAVLDTGVDYNHPDLTDNIWVNGNEIPDNSLDDDGNGYADDVRGWDFLNDDNDPLDDHGHGTHVAGIAAARGNNGMGVVGISWNSQIMALKFLDANGEGTYADGAEAIRYAADSGARVINCSWGGESYSPTLAAALSYASSKGSLIIAAAGNKNEALGSSSFYPAEDLSAVAVAATDQYDYKAAFSNYENIAVSAPGMDILSLRAAGTDFYNNPARIVDNYYYRANGTSMATPFVSGLAALVWSAHPGWSPGQVLAQIEASADYIDLVNPQYAGKLGSGRINAARALAEVLVSGQVQLQARSHYGGIVISAGEYSTTTGEQGLFSLTLPPGLHQVVASYPGYLPASRTDFSIDMVETASAGTVLLLGGDIAPEYGAIDLQDLAQVAASFNSNDGAADVTGDGIVDIYDLALVGRNYGRNASPWP